MFSQHQAVPLLGTVSFHQVVVLALGLNMLLTEYIWMSL
jgi:hypothetical protein